MTYKEADNAAHQLCTMRHARIVFVCADLTRANAYTTATFNVPFLRPVKRYRRLSTGAIEVKAVSDWRRN